MNRGLLTRSTTVTDRRIAAAPGPAAEAAAGEGRWRPGRRDSEKNKKSSFVLIIVLSFEIVMFTWISWNVVVFKPVVFISVLISEIRNQ